jgi:hypothetical protein
VVAAGWSGGDFALARYNPDGTLDPSFGGTGKVRTDFGRGATSGGPWPCSRTGGPWWPE